MTTHNSPAASQADQLLTTALATAASGWHVFPLSPGTKRPALRCRWEQRATTDADRIQRCWSTGTFNIGLATGPSGLVVIDLDTAKDEQQPPDEWAMLGIASGEDVFAVLAERSGAPVPETFTVRTPSGGRHLYFTAPAGHSLRNTAGTLGWLVDSRAWGGYVVAAGSTTETGAYTVADDRPPAKLPDWLANALQPPAPPRRSAPVELADGRSSKYVEAAVNGEIARVHSARVGTRNQTLFIASVALGQLVAGGSLAGADAFDLLQQAGESVGLRAGECQKTIASGLSVGAQRPRQVAA